MDVKLAFFNGQLNKKKRTNLKGTRLLDKETWFAN
jgi:hypothetical protein